MKEFEIEIERTDEWTFEGVVVVDPGGGALANIRFRYQEPGPGLAPSAEQPSLVLTKGGQSLAGRLRLAASIGLPRVLAIAFGLSREKAAKGGGTSARFKIPVLEDKDRLEPGVTLKELALRMNGLS